MNSREFLFWAYDSLINKGVVRAHLADIREHMSETNESGFRYDRLQEILTYATEHIPFYQNRKEWQGLEDFPVLDKISIRDNLQSFVKQNGLDEFKRVSTSGSTGVPFSSYQNRGKIFRNTADTFYFGSLVGYSLGERLLYIKLWNAANQKSNWLKFQQNIDCIDVTDQSLEYIGKTTVRSIQNSPRKIHLLAYASYYDQLLNYLSEYNLTFSNIGSMLAMSEALSLNTTKKLKNILGVNIYSRYSNVENGIIAQQTPSSRERFLLNTASYYVEILDMASDASLPLGELGRVVITDLYNEAMPFLRYDTGDLAKMEYDSTEGYFYLTEVHGRKMDLIYDTSGNPISPLMINNNMLLFPEVLQYQFVQKSEKDYQFLLNIRNEKYEREEELKTFFKTKLGDRSNLDVKYVSEIPVLASGKRKQVLNLWKRE